MSVQQTFGFVDAHSHLRSTSLASHGIYDCENLEEALLRFTAMSSVDPEADAFVAAADLITSGITGVQVMFHTFANKDGYLELLLKVLTGIRRSGIRALVILGVTDQAEFLPKKLQNKDLLPPWLHHTPGTKASELPEILDAAAELFPEFEFGVGPVGPQWCSDATLATLGEIAGEKLRVHSHLLESNRQRAWAEGDPIDRLIQHGLLGPKTSLAHGVWCNRDDLAKIHNFGASLVTCPLSNSLLKAGKADVGAWGKASVNFAVGLDSCADQTPPLVIARSAMDSITAVSALTRGGVIATGLQSDQDVVIWEDIDLGVCNSVTIRGKTLVIEGRLVYADEVADARAAIHEALDRDRVSRQARQALLSELMPRYQEEVSKCFA